MPTRYDKEFKQNIINLYKQGESVYIHFDYFTACKGLKCSIYPFNGYTTIIFNLLSNSLNNF